VIGSFERQRAAVSGGELAYLDQGEGPAVLLLHGYPTSSYLWRREAWLLSQRMRGVIAQLLALDAPELDVKSLVLLDSPGTEAPANKLGTLPHPPPQETKDAADSVVRDVLGRGVKHAGRLSPEDVDAYLRPWLDEPGALFRAARALTGGALAGREQDIAAIDIPVLLIWGEDDPIVSTDAGERLNDLLAGSTLALLPGCSHFVNEDAPQTIGPLIHEYLRSRYLHDSHHHEHAAADGPIPIFLERPPQGFDRTLPDQDQEED